MDDYTTRGAEANPKGEAHSGLVFDLDSLMAFLRQLPDTRRARGKVHDLAKSLAMALLAKLSGEDSLRGIAQWLRERQPAWLEVFALRKPRTPSRNTLTRLLGEVVAIERLEQLFQAFVQSLPDRGPSIVIALDGKTLRGTIDMNHPHGTHLLAAYVPEEGLVLFQMQVDCKENEIPVATRLLKHLDLRGKIVTGDALLTQRQLCLQIVAAGGDYLCKVKGNQHQLHQDLVTLFAPERCVKGFSPAKADFRSAALKTKEHGRLEMRTLTVSRLLNDFTTWPHLAQVFKLVCEVRQPHKPSSVAITYGITSLRSREASPAQLLEWMRLHWGIENGLHYRRDVTLNEDRCRVRTGHAAQALAALNNLVISLCNWLGFDYLPEARRHFAAHPDQALKLILRSPARL